MDQSYCGPTWVVHTVPTPRCCLTPACHFPNTLQLFLQEHCSSLANSLLSSTLYPCCVQLGDSPHETVPKRPWSYSLPNSLLSILGFQPKGYFLGVQGYILDTYFPTVCNYNYMANCLISCFMSFFFCQEGNARSLGTVCVVNCCALHILSASLKCGGWENSYWRHCMGPSSVMTGMVTGPEGRRLGLPGPAHQAQSREMRSQET